MCCRYCDRELSSVPMVQFGRSKMLKTSAMASIDRRPGSGIRCCARRLVTFCGGEMIALRGTIVPSGRRRPLKVDPRVPQVSAVVARLPDAGAQVMEAAHLEAASHLPDAAEYGPVALIVLRQPPFPAQREL